MDFGSVSYRKIAIVVALSLLGIGSALAGYSFFYHKNPIAAISQIFVPSPQEVFGKPNLLVLVEGLDYDYNQQDEEYSTASRSDVIWAVNLDFTDKQIYELSVPRDMATADFPDGHEAKINEAQSDGGEREASAVIAKFLGISGFDRYVILRINATKELIAAIGGVDVNVQNSDPTDKSEMVYDDTWGHLHIHLKPGFQHLSGDQAVGYMRFRHDWCGDPCRIKRQQQVLKAVADKLRNNKFNTLIHVSDLIGVVRRNVSTNLTDPEMLSLAGYFADVTPRDIHTAQVPYTGDKTLADGGDALVVDASGMNALVQNMLVAPPAPEPSPDAMVLAGLDPTLLRVDVENGSGVNGAAKRIADQLRRDGFAIGDVGDAARSDMQTTRIEEHSKVAFAGAKVRSLLPVSQSVVVVQDTPPAQTAAPSQVSDVTVIVGRDLANASFASAKPKPKS